MYKKKKKLHVKSMGHDLDVHQNDAKLQTHPPHILINITMSNLLKINVYNFKYTISVGNITKLIFYLSFTRVGAEKIRFSGT